MNNDPRIHDPISAVAVPVGEAWQRHQNAPPHIRKDNTAYVGGLISGAAGYIAVTLGPQAHSFPREYVIGYAAVTCLGLVMVASGLRGGMPRDLLRIPRQSGR
jgi:hypothetical protein